jgi:hypothetical protein
LASVPSRGDLMDPVSIIVAAVIAGAASGTTDAVKEEVKTVYSALRERLFDRFRDSVLVKKFLTDVEREPTDENQKYLAESLSNGGITDSDELVAMANRVVEADGRPPSEILQFSTVGKNAKVESSGTSIDGLSQDSTARIFHRHDIGENADVKGSPSVIRFRDSKSP